MTLDDWVKIGGGIIGGGFVGAIFTNWRTDQRNKIQPISQRIIVSYVDLPRLLQGYSPVITLNGADEYSPEPYHFEQLAIIQIELKNIGNKDIPKFDLGINIAEENKIIGVQENTEDRYHKVSYKPEVTITSPSDQLDCVLEPFNRKDTYTITLLVNAEDRDIAENIQLSKTLPVRFVDADAKAKAANVPVLVATLSVFILAFVFAVNNLTNPNNKHLAAIILASLIGTVAGSIIRGMSK